MESEYYTGHRGEGLQVRFIVYRQVGQRQIDYCECKTSDAALQIAQSLNLMRLLVDGQIVQSILFNDGSEIFLVVKGELAEKAYLQALPLLDSGTGDAG
jgi:hypothetical protein